MPTLVCTRAARAAAIGALALIGALASSAGPALAQMADGDILADSVLVLEEQAGSGAYERYTVTLTTRNEQATLATNKDGAAATFAVSARDLLALWQSLLKNDLATLPNAPADHSDPGSSDFTLTYRVLTTTGGFKAAGVDTLPDARYRTIVRAILDLATRYERAPRG